MTEEQKAFKEDELNIGEDSRTPNREGSISELRTGVDKSTGAVSALIIGDPHFKVSNVRETDAMADAIVDSASQRRPDIIVVLGDTLDRHEAIHVSPLTRAVKFLARLMEIAPTYVLIGNHDLKNNRQFLSDEHPFIALKYWSHRMTIVDTTTMVTINGQQFVFVPYVPPGRFVEALDNCPGWEMSTCIFAHQEFKGAKMGAIISVEGDEWPLVNPYVITGHIHDYQEPQVNILYTGTPIQHAFGDRHDKTISYVTFHSPNERECERIDLGLRRKQIARITCAEVSTYVPHHNCELKIIISGTSGEIKATMKHVNINVWKQAGHRIAYKELPLDRTSISDTTDGNIVSKAPLRFSQVLYKAISDNPRLDTLYTRIFGSVQAETVQEHMLTTVRNLTLSSTTNNTGHGATSGISTPTVSNPQPIVHQTISLNIMPK